MLKHYYRLVYWKRRIGRTLGWRRRSGTGPGTGTKPGDRGPGRRDGRLRRTMERVRPLLVFVVLVLIVVLASALLGWRDDTFGAGHREGGVTVRPSGGVGTGVVTVSCGPRDGACAVRGGATERAVAGVG